MQKRNKKWRRKLKGFGRDMRSRLSASQIEPIEESEAVSEASPVPADNGSVATDVDDTATESLPAGHYDRFSHLREEEVENDSRDTAPHTADPPTDGEDAAEPTLTDMGFPDEEGQDDRDAATVG